MTTDLTQTPLQELQLLVRELRERWTALSSEGDPVNDGSRVHQIAECGCDEYRDGPQLTNVSTQSLFDRIDRTIDTAGPQINPQANSDELYHSLVDRLPIHVTRIDLNGRITFANETFCQLVGRPAEELIGRTDFDFSPPELAEKYQFDNQQVAATGNALHAIEENRLDGRQSYYEVWKLPVYDTTGQVVEIQAVFWDVTEREENRVALARERDLLRTLMDSLPDLIYVKDAGGRYITVNRSLQRLWGNPPLETIIGKTVADFVRDDLALVYSKDDHDVLQFDQSVVDSEEKVMTSTGECRIYSTTKVPLHDQHGNVTGLVGIDRDITRRKRAEEEIRLAREAADAANRAKGDFLANMSHEIRTPLNAVIGITDLLLEGELGQVHREYLEIIRDSGESLMVVINDILDFSKIEAGRLELESMSFNLSEVVRNATRALALRAHNKELRLACEIDSRVPQCVVGDPVRLRQVMTNLIGNAIKFTPQGEVVISVSVVEDFPNRVDLRFQVRDSGIGIPADKLDHIFEAFAQADASTTRRFGGTGLGLAICTRLVQAMGGQLQVSSKAGMGSEFFFNLGLPKSQGADLESPPQIPAVLSKAQVGAKQSLQILLVEDSPMNQVLAIGILQREGHLVTVACDGMEAVDSFQSGEFDLILMDIQMPEMDGLQATALIREIEAGKGGHIPILAMTAHALTGDRERCLAAGMDGYLAKPIRLRDLVQAIQDLQLPARI